MLKNCVLGGLLAITAAGPTPAVDTAKGWVDARRKVDTAFQTRLEALAARCTELELHEQAEQTRKWWVPRADDRQYLFLTSPAEAAPEVAGAAGHWHAHFLQARRTYAEQLFAIAEQALQEGESAAAYRLLHEVLRQDPEHPAGKIIGLTRGRPLRVRSPRRPHPTWKWEPGRYWTVESAHFRIQTNTSRTAAVDLANELEELHAVWRQLFFVFWSSPESLQARFEGRFVPLGALPKHEVILFRDRAEYIAKLVPIERQIGGSVGYYMPSQEVAFFYSGDGAQQGTRFHEVTHQLFQETGFRKQDAGESWNVWVLEGVAVYMESLRRFDGYYTVGGFDSERLQFARARRFSGSFFMPFTEMMGLGRRELQQHEFQSQIYSQAAGLVHCLMDHESGKFRSLLLEYLAAVYARQDHPELLYDRLNLSAEQLDTIYVESLQVTDRHLIQLPSFQGVEILALGRTHVTDVGAHRLGNCDQLATLDLSHTKITDAALQEIGSLPRLSELELAGTAIGDAGVAALTGLDQLTYLGLAGTQVTDRVVDELGKMQTLKRIDLEGTGVSRETVEAVRGGLPANAASGEN